MAFCSDKYKPIKRSLWIFWEISAHSNKFMYFHYSQWKKEITLAPLSACITALAYRSITTVLMRLVLVLLNRRPYPVEWPVSSCPSPSECRPPPWRSVRCRGRTSPAAPCHHSGGSASISACHSEAHSSPAASVFPPGYPPTGSRLLSWRKTQCRQHCVTITLAGKKLPLWIKSEPQLHLQSVSFLHSSCTYLAQDQKVFQMLV